jgi:hypothetical protein
MQLFRKIRRLINNHRHAQWQKHRQQNSRWVMGMTSSNEQAYFQWLAEHVYKQNGAIVELGCWLGSISIPIVKGLRSNKRTDNPKLHVYDLFQWEHNMEDTVSIYRPDLKGTYHDGDDFEPLYHQMVADYHDALIVKKSDLGSEKWVGGAIEILVVDAMKYESLLDNIQQQFFPSLIAGKSFVIHQDFLHFYETWIHIAMYRLRHYFDWIYQVPDAGSVVFKCRHSIPKVDCAFPESMQQISDGEIEDVYHWLFEMLNTETHEIAAAAHIMSYIHKKDTATAKRLYKRYVKQYPFDSKASSQMKRLTDYVTRFALIDL